MNKKKFRAELYKTYIASGYQDPVLIQEYIQIAESFVFEQKQFTRDDFKLLTAKLSNSQNQSNGSYALGTSSCNPTN